MSEDYKWKPFEDLPEDWAGLSDGGLASLLQLWQQRLQELDTEGAASKLNQRLHREWAIETGVIEQVYSLDRGTTEVLLERGIDVRYIPDDATDRDPEWVAQVIQDHEAVLNGLFDFVNGNRALTVGYIKELHAALLRRQKVTTVKDQFGELREIPVEHGAFKKHPNNPRRTDGTTYEYCPPEHVASEMDRLVELHASHEELKVPPEIESAWLHHRFAQIHPFTDGNGRVARSIASIVLIKAGGFPLVIRREDRARYIDALELADSGMLAPIVGLVTQRQRESLIDVLNSRDETRPPDTVEAVLNSAAEVLRLRTQTTDQRFNRLQELVAGIVHVAYVRMEVIVNSLVQSVSNIEGVNVKVGLVRGKGTEKGIEEATKLAGIRSQSDQARAGVSLRIESPALTEIRFSAHQVGREAHGLLALLLWTYVDDEVELANEVFLLPYTEDVEHAKGRFIGWFEKGMATALNIWRRRL